MIQTAAFRFLPGKVSNVQYLHLMGGAAEVSDRAYKMKFVLGLEVLESGPQSKLWKLFFGQGDSSAFVLAGS